MSLPKQKFRELCLQLLFSSQFASLEEKDIQLYLSQFKVTRRHILKVVEQVIKIQNQQAILDETIKKVCLGYELERIQTVELNILRLAIYEMLFEKELSKSIIISEAIRLAKKFSTNDSIPFVNGLLDQVPIKDEADATASV